MLWKRSAEDKHKFGTEPKLGAPILFLAKQMTLSEFYNSSALNCLIDHIDLFKYPSHAGVAPGLV